MNFKNVENSVPLLFVFLWSTGFIGAKYGLPYAEPFLFLFIRMALAVVLILAISTLTKTTHPTSPAMIVHIIASGMFIHVAYLGGVFYSISLGLSAGVTALIVGFQPILTAFIVGVFFKEKILAAQWVGLVLGLAGISFVLADGFVGETTLASLLPAIVALLGISIGTIYQKRYCSTNGTISTSLIQYASSAVIFGALALAFESLMIEWSVELIGAILWLTIALSIGSIYLLYYMISNRAVTNIASLFYLVPPSTALLGYMLFDEMLTSLDIAGFVMSVTGVLLVIRSDLFTRVSSFSVRLPRN